MTEGGTASITVQRSDATAALDVEYTIADGTAHGGTDYDNSTPCTASSPCLLSFKAKGKTASFKVKTTANTLADGERTVVLTFATPAALPTSEANPRRSSSSATTTRGGRSSSAAPRTRSTKPTPPP